MIAPDSRTERTRLSRLDSAQLDSTHRHAAGDAGEDDLRITLPASSENIGLLRHIFGGLGEAYRISAAKMDDVLLALSEAATNVAVHAYPDGAGPLTVSARVDGDRMAVRVRDHGRGMRPRIDRDGLGVGLGLIASVAESLELRARGDGGTDVAMVLPLADVDAAGTSAHRA